MRFVSGSGAGSVMSALQGHDGCGTCYVIFEKGVLCGSEDDRGLSFWCLACLVYVPCIRGPCTSRERCLFLSRPSPSLASAQILSASVSQLHPPTFSSNSFRHISASNRAYFYTSSFPYGKVQLSRHVLQHFSKAYVDVRNIGCDFEIFVEAAGSML